MSHRTIERIIGCLLTDADLRRRFTRSPTRTLAQLGDQGWELSRLEVAALLATGTTLWSDVAARMDPRLRRASVTTDDESAH